MKVNSFTLTIEDHNDDSVRVILSSDPRLTDENVDDLEDTPSVRFVEAVMDLMEEFFDDNTISEEQNGMVH